jgi:hypothetical protein
MKDDSLVYRCITSQQLGVRSFKDQRRKVNRLVAKYVDVEGIEYRKSFEIGQSDGYPFVPYSGTLKQLNEAKYQWEKDGKFTAELLERLSNKK